MILRRELSGLHQYERETGLHILLDEVSIPIEEAVNRGPRHLSLMLTRRCNLKCPFCYVEKSNSDASIELLSDIFDAASDLQVLDVTLGGGEPTLHKDFTDIISYAWENHEFGVSVTTNAVDIAPLNEVSGMLSSVRVSTDNKIRQLDHKLQKNIYKISGAHKVGANMLWSPSSLIWARETINTLASLGVENFLIIPEHHNGEYILSDDDWYEMKKFISEHLEKFQIMITSDATSKISAPMLDTEHNDEYLFAHIDETGNIRRRSWGESVDKVSSKEEIINGLQLLNPLRSKLHENMG